MLFQSSAPRRYEATAGTQRVFGPVEDAIDSNRGSNFALPRPVPLSVLRIPRINLEVPVLEGTSEVTLNRGLVKAGSTCECQFPTGVWMNTRSLPRGQASDTGRFVAAT